MSAFKDWLKKLIEPAVLVPAVIAVVIALGSGGVLGHLFWRNSKSANAAVTIDCPPNDGTIQRAVKVYGKAALPEGDSVWIVIRSIGQQDYYPVGTAGITSPAKFGDVNWSYTATVGSRAEVGTQYQIYAVILDSENSTYLSNMTVGTPSGQVLASSMDASAPELPPGILAKDYINVTRGNSPENC